jgi:hypothetical protein
MKDLTAHACELATTIKDVESKPINGDFMNGRGSYRRPSVRSKCLKMPLDFMFLSLVLPKSLLLPSLLYSFITDLGFFVEDGSVDELHMSITLCDPSVCWL